MFYNRRTIAFLLYNSPKPIVKAYLIFISIQEEIMENLSLSKNNRYLTQCGKPFFWLGDTAWLLFHKLSEEDAYIYLKNRADKGYNVIQAVLVYAVPEMDDVNKMYIPDCDINGEEYWHHCDRIIKMAEELGLYMGLLPSWGSLVKHGVITNKNAGRYADFLAQRYKDFTNIVWILGGDVNASGFEEIYDIFGNTFKKANPERLVTFHPFGRCRSSMWFHNAPWLDFNMFQSGHRRYDQAALGVWDDVKKTVSEFSGEDNWKYTYTDHSLEPVKPTLDAEPGYEWIPQGLHDPKEPYWKAADVRRYAYWSVFAGACGHTYGDNAVMQFYGDFPDDKGSYGPVCGWREALHHEGSGQMRYLKELISSVDFTVGVPRDDLLIGGQREKYERVAVFAGMDYILAYSFTGNSFELNMSSLGEADAWWFSPVSGVYSYIGRVSGKEFSGNPPKVYGEDKDIVLVLKKAQT